MRFSIGRIRLRLPPAFDSWRSLHVRSVPTSYAVVTDTGTPAARVRALLSENPGNVLLADRKVWDLHLKNVRVDRDRVFLTAATEDLKTPSGVFRLLDFLDKRDFTKREKLIVVGGGIIEDVGAFAGAIFKRGIDWIYFPTTLLSMCDSCIGGKTSLNYKKAKNQLALFSAPSRVVINPQYLRTLSRRHIRSGLGEALKLHAIAGPAAFANYAENVDSALASDLDSLTRIFKGALSIKKAVVEQDEFEKNIRRSMNYGHTVGHAVEAMSGYRISHGEAVTIGMIVANELSRRRGMLPGPSADLLERHMFKILGRKAQKEVSGLDLSKLSGLLSKDKKTRGPDAHFVLLKRLGQTEIVPLRIGPGLAASLTGIIRKKFH